MGTQSGSMEGCDHQTNYCRKKYNSKLWQMSLVSVTKFYRALGDEHVSESEYVCGDEDDEIFSQFVSLRTDGSVMEGLSADLTEREEVSN